jgi:hypothetical protein
MGREEVESRTSGGKVYFIAEPQEYGVPERPAAQLAKTAMPWAKSHLRNAVPQEAGRKRVFMLHYAVLIATELDGERKRGRTPAQS